MYFLREIIGLLRLLGAFRRQAERDLLMTLFWICLTFFGVLVYLAYGALHLWGSVIAELEKREGSVYGESLASLKPPQQAKPVVPRFLPRPNMSFAASVTKR